MNIFRNINLNHKKIFNLRLKRNEKLKRNEYSNNKNNINNFQKNIENSSINSEDINYIGPPNLKDKILSPGDDDDICLYKQKRKVKENFEEDNFCIYNVTNINMNIKNNQKKLLILDLDETLVHSSFKPLGKDNNKKIEPDIFLKIFFDKNYYNLYIYSPICQRIFKRYE